MSKYFGLAGIFAGVLSSRSVSARSGWASTVATPSTTASPPRTSWAATTCRRRSSKGIEEAGLTNLTIDSRAATSSVTRSTRAPGRAFAGYMRIHALESSDGLTYAEMGRYATADGNPAGTSDETKALKDEKGEPVSNFARNTWVTETALATALNTSYMAERVALFGIVVGVALLLSGIGFIILAVVALGVPAVSRKKAPATPTPTPVV